MAEKPDTIPATIHLPDGELQATAFRTGEDEREMLTIYELAMTDGTPFTFDETTGMKVSLEQLPPRSKVRMRMRTPAGL